MRRNLIFFLVGAALTLAIVLGVRAASDGGAGAPPRAAGTPATTPALVRAPARTVKLHAHHRSPGKHRRAAASTTSSPTGAARSASATAGTARTPARPSRPSAGTGTGSSDPTATTPPADEPPADTVPGDTPPAETTPQAASDQTTTPVVTIPNPATPDNSVGTP